MPENQEHLEPTARHTFGGRIAVVTGGGTGMGRQLVIQLAREGCSVVACDIDAANVATTVDLASAEAPHGTRVTAHTCDVADEAEVARFRDEVVREHDTTSVNFVFNNAGIHGSPSFVTGDRREWERIFAISWNGVYYCSRAFVPLLVAGEGGCLVNTSSVNGFWAVSSSYSAAKFAIKGFTEALIDDFRANAPHVTVAVVMPGYIGTDILSNSRKVLEGPVAALPEADLAEFRDRAPVSAEQAAKVILDGVRSRTWRILVGNDAHLLDERVRHDPLAVYGPSGIRIDDLFDDDALGIMQTLAAGGETGDGETHAPVVTS